MDTTTRWRSQPTDLGVDVVGKARTQEGADTQVLAGGDMAATQDIMWLNDY